MSDDPDWQTTPARAAFPSTAWSLIVALQGPDPQSDAALGRLCSAYWYPLYAYIRRSGYRTEDAQDLTQDFLASLLERRSLQRNISPEKGRFRSFLIASLKHFLSNAGDRARAQKRGGGKTILSIDWEGAERTYSLEPVYLETPEAVFDRNWALSVLQRVQDRLREDFLGKGKVSEWEQYWPLLSGDDDAGYRAAAERLGKTEGAVKSAVYRLRRIFGKLLRRELAETVIPEELDGEIHYLLHILSR